MGRFCMVACKYRIMPSPCVSLWHLPAQLLKALDLPPTRHYLVNQVNIQLNQLNKEWSNHISSLLKTSNRFSWSQNKKQKRRRNIQNLWIFGIHSVLTMIYPKFIFHTPFPLPAFTDFAFVSNSLPPQKSPAVSLCSALDMLSTLLQCLVGSHTPVPWTNPP